MKPLLYSTNVYLKLLIHEMYFGDIHYVWCSEIFDSQQESRYRASGNIPPSSNPADIYRRLKTDVEGGDKHSPLITEKRASIESMAISSESKECLSEAERDEIIYLSKTADIQLWRPLIYVIPVGLVKTRLELVPPTNRAGIGMEYIIPDLNRDEFDIIEL